MSSGQRSIRGYAQQGLNMAKSKKVGNGVFLLDLEKSGFSRSKGAFDEIHKTLKDGYKSETYTQDYTKKHFAKCWRKDYPWLYVRVYVEKGDGTKEFDPAELCIKCNKYYAANSRVKLGNNGFAMPRRLLDDDPKPPQKKGLEKHEESDGHGRATGGDQAVADKNVFDSIYFEAQFNIAAQTHPFFSYLMHKFKVDIGNKLHSVSTAKKVTIVVGCIIKSAVYSIIRSTEWLTFGSDGADIKDAMDIFYIWVRAVVDGDPIQLFVAARPEVRKFAAVLFDIFMDAITGYDINYGYDYRKKLEYQRIHEHNEKIKEKAGYNKKDLKKFKAPTFTNVVQEYESQFPGSLTLDPKDVLSKTVCTVQDGANNMSADRGFAGLFEEKQKEVIKCVICGRVHCIDHEWDLWCKVISKSESNLEGLADIIEALRKYANYVDVYEELISVAALYDVTYQYINKDFRLRWLKHLVTAIAQTQNNIDLLIHLLIWNINNIKNRNNAQDKKRRTLCIDLLKCVCDRYWDFFVYYPVLEEAGKLSVKCQSWSKTVIDAANTIDSFNDFCKSRTGTEKDASSKILSRVKDKKIINKLLNENINALKELNVALKELELIEEEFVIDIDITNHLKKDKKLASEYVEGIEKFKSYELWKCYRKYCDINYWDIEDLEQWLKDNKQDFIDECCKKFKLKINCGDTWQQYKRFCTESLRIYGCNLSSYNYHMVITQNLKSKPWIARNKDLGLVFQGILTEGFGNGMAESIGHIGNDIMDPQRKTMGFLYFDSLCEIRVNGLSFEKANDIVRLAIDFWARAGYHHALNVNFDAKTEAVCVQHVERYNNIDDDEKDAKQTDYKRRFKAKQQRQDILTMIFNQFMDTLNNDNDDQ